MPTTRAAGRFLGRWTFLTSQINLLGTVLTSCLLVPGLSFVLRGLSESRDKLNKHAGAMVSMCLLLASLAYSVTTAYNVTSQHKHSCHQYCDVPQVTGISHLVAIVLLVCYAVLLVWSTVTHSHLIAKRRSKYKKAILDKTPAPLGKKRMCSPPPWHSWR